ncbi:hypothetical protein HG536_0B05330 [Torulaspora globosa]|uniref:Uncharacterized protein n=1 Tax=Torulaspora globosa TaxID=48254 RepID=A0A7G3ZDT2_9SACH|nr:uncharacterized protein HG536_0B05330 [Torulaspora globosa]QLL31668.1 hypothetical protein HG536_0B05330 [Torulaspora globosa]
MGSNRSILEALAPVEYNQHNSRLKKRMRLIALLALAPWLPAIAAINYGSLEGEEESPVKSVKPKATKMTSNSHFPTSKPNTKSSSVKMSTSTLTSMTTQKTITYAEDPLTTVTTTNELGSTTVKPLWWIPSEASTDLATTTATEAQSGLATESYTTHAALAKQASLSNTTSGVITQSNAAKNAMANLGLAGSMAVVLMNLI